MTFVVLALAVMALLTAASALVAPADTAPREAGSSYASQPTGGKAAYLLLQELRYAPERSFDPFTDLDADAATALVVIADPQRGPSQQDVAALSRFVENGGWVLAAGDLAAGFLPGIAERPARGERRLRTHRAAAPSPLAAGGASVETDAPPRRLTLEPAWVLVYGTREDPAVLTARRGAGRIVWWASSRPLTNAGIGSPGHVELLLNALGPPGVRRILWDEYYHGHARSLWSYVGRTPLVWAGAQLALGLCLAFVSFARRRGPIRPRRDEPRTSPIEFIETMGALYERGREAGPAVSTARGRVRRLLAGRSGLSAAASDDRLAAAAQRYGLDRAGVESLLDRARLAAEDPATSERDAVALVRELQALGRTIEGNRRPSAARQRTPGQTAGETRG